MNYLEFMFKRFKYEIYQRPSEWMAPEALEALQHRLIAVAKKRIGVRPNYGFFSNLKFFENKLIVICSCNGNDLCFNAMTYLGRYKKRLVVHLGSVYSLERNEGQMQLLYYFGCLYLFYYAGFRRVYITSLTHTPKIFGAVTEAYDQVFPNGCSGAQPERFHLVLCDMLMETYMREFELRHPAKVDESFVIKGFRIMADGSTLFPDTKETVPKHRKSVYNDYCQENLDYMGGDDILQVGILKPTTFFKNLMLLKKGGGKPYKLFKNIRNYIFMRISGPGRGRRSESCSQ